MYLARLPESPEGQDILDSPPSSHSSYQPLPQSLFLKGFSHSPITRGLGYPHPFTHPFKRELYKPDMFYCCFRKPLSPPWGSLHCQGLCPLLIPDLGQTETKVGSLSQDLSTCIKVFQIFFIWRGIFSPSPLTEVGRIYALFLLPAVHVRKRPVLGHWLSDRPTSESYGRPLLWKMHFPQTDPGGTLGHGSS